MNRLRDYNLNAFILLLLAFLLGMCLISGCTTQKSVNKWLDTKPQEKTEEVVGRYLTLHELFAATFCDDKYPVQESTETKTDTLKVPVFIKGDSIPCPPVTDTKTGKTYTPMVKCPDVSYYQTTITTLEKTTKESTAKADRYRLESLETQKALTKETEAHTATINALDDMTGSRNFWRILAIGLMLAIGGFVIFKIVR